MKAGLNLHASKHFVFQLCGCVLAAFFYLIFKETFIFPPVFLSSDFQNLVRKIPVKYSICHRVCEEVHQELKVLDA